MAAPGEAVAPVALQCVRKMRRPTGVVAIAAQVARALHSAGFRVDTLTLAVGRGIRPLFSGRLLAAPILLSSGRLGVELFARLAESFSRLEKPAVLVGHGDCLLQDVLFIHNLIARVLEETGTAGSRQPRVLPLHEHVLRNRRFRICLTCSSLVRNEIVTRYGVPEEKVRVVRPGYDPQRFRPRDGIDGATRERLGLPRGAFAVGFVTSGDFRKRGLSNLLAAIRDLPASVRKNTFLLILGKDSISPYGDALRASGLAQRVIHLRYVRSPEILFRALDVIVHPAVFEEFGLVVLGAAASGVPVVTSARVGASEILPEGPLLLEKPEPEAIAAALLLLYRDPEARWAWGRRMRDAASEYTWERFRARFLEILAEEGLVPAFAR